MLTVQLCLFCAAVELAEGAVLFAALSQAGGVESVRGLELAPAGKGAGSRLPFLIAAGMVKTGPVW